MTWDYCLLPTKSIFSLSFLYSIEHCFKEIQSEVHKLHPDVQLQTPADYFEWLSHYNCDVSKSPSIPHGDVRKFLRTVVKLFCLSYNDVKWVSRGHSLFISIC